MKAQPLRSEPEPSAAIRQIAVVVNATAGGVRKRPTIVDELTSAVRGRGEVLVTSDPAGLDRAILRARLDGADTIGICGGDGTNLHTLTAIDRVYKDAAWPRILLLTAGTLNTAASHFHCVGRAADRLEQALKSEEPLTVRSPLVRVNERVGFIFGSQMVAHVLDAYYAGSVSPVGAVILATRIVTSAAIGSAFARDLFRTEPVRIELDGRPLGRFEPTCLLASVVSSPAVGMRATFRGGEGGGFHFICLEKEPTVVFKEVGRLWCGLPLRCHTIDQVAHQAELHFGQPVRYTMDGDLFEAETIRITATPPIEIVLPGVQ